MSVYKAAGSAPDQIRLSNSPPSLFETLCLLPHSLARSLIHSVGRSVRPSIHPSIPPFVGRSVAFQWLYRSLPRAVHTRWRRPAPSGLLSWGARLGKSAGLPALLPTMKNAYFFPLAISAAAADVPPTPSASGEQSGARLSLDAQSRDKTKKNSVCL